MPISANLLPSELHYIIPLAERFGSDAPISKFDTKQKRHVDYAETLSPDEVDLLRKLYGEMRQKNHGPKLSEWYHGAFKNNCPPETTWPIWGLFCIFEQLSKLGIKPFNDRTVRFHEKPKVLDWNKLPAELRDLAGPAEKYGGTLSEIAILDYFESEMTAEEKSELQELNSRIGKDWEAIDKWLNEFPMTEHDEAGLVYSTIHRLTLGFDAGYLQISE